MNPLGPPPPQSAGQAPPNYRQPPAVQDRPQFEGQGADQGRNSPQPSASDRGDNDPDKAFKDLRMYFTTACVLTLELTT
jgi:hypothetical protein